MRPVSVRFLIGLLALQGCKTPKDPDGEDPLPKGATVAVDVTASGPVTCADPGLRAERHFDRKQAPEQPLEGAYLAGGGLIVEDFDGDGHLDLFLPSEHTTQVWFGRGDGTFVDRSDQALAGVDLKMAVGGTAVDIDGDGDIDLFVTRWERPNVLLRNDGSGRFTDITASSGLGAHAWKSQSASWADIDGDGDLDLFVGSYGETPDTFDDPEMAAAEPAELWRNNGDGTFSDASHLLPPEVHDGYSFMSAWYDLNGDGFPELFSVHDFGRVRQSVLLSNHGGQSFTVDHGSRFHPQHEDMGMAVGDLNGDDLPDVLLTGWRSVAYLESMASPEGDNGVVYVNATAARSIQIKWQHGTAQQVFGWGAEFGDVDNDGDLDAVMVFGYWSTYDNPGDPRKQHDGLWIQDEAGRFDNRGPAPEWLVNDSGISRGIVLADVNGDGWLDLLKRQLDGPTLLYVSRCGSEGWLRVRLRAPGPNTRAIGATVRVISGDQRQIRWVHSGSSGMYTGAPLEVHFGLGDLERVDRVEVLWPDGEISVVEGVQTRQLLTLTRAEGP